MDNKCAWCGTLTPKYLQIIDHVIPRALNGKNTQILCAYCNLYKTRYDIVVVRPKPRIGLVSYFGGLSKAKRKALDNFRERGYPKRISCFASFRGEGINEVNASKYGEEIRRCFMRVNVLDDVAAGKLKFEDRALDYERKEIG